jgi:hypothetical protein
MSRSSQVQNGQVLLKDVSGQFSMCETSFGRCRIRLIRGHAPNDTSYNTSGKSKDIYCKIELIFIENLMQMRKKHT